MRTLIKLCGLTRECDIEAVNELNSEYGVDYIGFVFAKGSKREISKTHAAKLRNMLDKGITATGVFVRERIEKIIGLVSERVINAVQLHGGESEEYITALREELKRIKREEVTIIKAFKVTTPNLKESVENSSADLVLIDSPTAGSGESYELGLLKGIERKFFLAGGLSVENVAESIRAVKPFGVDVSSGIEKGGDKNKELMYEFVREVRIFDADNNKKEIKDRL